MIFGVHKAPFLKRAVAFIFDSIILIIVAVAAVWALSSVFHYDEYYDAYQAKIDFYQNKYNVNFEISEEQYNLMSPDKRENWDRAYKDFISDEESLLTFNKIVNLTIGMTAISILTGYIVVELIFPLILGDGQTLGKKVFNIAVMSINGVRIKPVQLFARTILGKFAIETMLPVYFLFMYFMFNSASPVIAILVTALVIIQITLLLFRNNRVLHDVLAQTVVVDNSEQIIFENYDELLKAKEEYYASEANKRDIDERGQ